MSAVRCLLCCRLVAAHASCLTPKTFPGANQRVLQISQLHSSVPVTAGEKWRLQHGMSRSGTEYGPLTDLPDWSFVDGRTAPISKRQQIRNRRQHAINTRIRRLMGELDEAKVKAEALETDTEDNNSHATADRDTSRT